MPLTVAIALLMAPPAGQERVCPAVVMRRAPHCYTATALKLTVSKAPHPTPTLDHIGGHSLRAIFMSKIPRQLRFRDRGHLNIAPWMYRVGHHRDRGGYLSVALYCGRTQTSRKGIGKLIPVKCWRKPCAKPSLS